MDVKYSRVHASMPLKIYTRTSQYIWQLGRPKKILYGERCNDTIVHVTKYLG